MSRILPITAAFITVSFLSIGQDNSWMVLEPEEPQNDTAEQVVPGDTAHLTLNFNTPDGRMKVNSDKGVEELSRVLGKPLPGKNVTVPGYRVQIFFGDINSAEQKSKEFKKLHFTVHCETEYKEPNFHVKVGNFYTRLQAEEFKNEISDVFPMSIIIKDDIELPKLEE